jgi:dipeptidyl aminopeptidase/acylaminoacyl peptidase
MASNLVRADTNGYEDIFVRDRRTGTTRLVSVPTKGEWWSTQPSISGDGRYVVFTTRAEEPTPDSQGTLDVFVRDRLTGMTKPVSVIGNQDSCAPVISDDGRYVAFVSSETTLVPGDTNGSLDVFVCDRVTGTLVRASVSTTGSQGAGYSADVTISGHGRHVAFYSTAEDLVPRDTNRQPDVFVRDLPFG